MVLPNFGKTSNCWGCPMEEKRKDQRLREEKKVVIEFYPEGKDFRPKNVTYALTRDISEGGQRLLTDRYFPIGTLLKITLSLSRTRQIVNVVAKVRWVTNFHTSDLFEMGIEYLHEIPESVLSMMKNHQEKEAKTPSSAWK
jgi:Tfp pilus assembly protein PilZ